MLEDLKPDDQITVTFPMVEQTITYTVLSDQQWTTDPRKNKNPPDSSITYKCHFKGNTLVDFSPRPDDRWYRNYQREHFKENKAPLKKVQRYVSSQTINW